ncbi:MAG: UDP-3-O-(3-hydroxymyristoyl)glucosamine N-acyltransferase [Crocinitomicaceae bacterium]|nr:UDP-3-O-(3-hydroxymyristoyl)glucosamine N-acyltransferase [Crocinitomicaceae bacterium]
MKFSAVQIASLIEGEVIGDPNTWVNDLSKIEEGRNATISFLANSKYEEFIYSTGASIVIVSKDFEPAKELPEQLTLIKVKDPYACFAKLLELYNDALQPAPQIEEQSKIDASAQIGENIYVGAFAYIGKDVIIGNNVKIYPNAYIGDGVEIGSNTTIHPNVTIYHHCKIGKNCIIHAGTTIGADGFGFAPDQNGQFKKVPQIGNVVLEDYVEIGANATIDRATMGSTILRTGVKIDNLVQVAHNVEIGAHSALAAQAGVAGSTKIGQRVYAGGQVGISGHIKIANDTKIVAQSGIPGNVKKEGSILMGTPGIPMDEFKKSFFGFRKLPYILKKLREIEDRLNKTN